MATVQSYVTRGVQAYEFGDWRIERDGYVERVFHKGQEVENCVSITMSHTVNELPRIELTLLGVPTREEREAMPPVQREQVERRIRRAFRDD